ncbi:DUF3592 domain-containing protein [Microbulbifer marinus]|uniref:DUF3592 domain-containing protein n=1 Tax=Microbulbifer marinus TaxID=658218 RepID=A0A1H4B4T6_9GAMM|nr:DUF3592 domain-containing protein [Microbulbifer marinus]SEA43109.1 Protein of unknown function [Microbulbifer marinus]
MRRPAWASWLFLLMGMAMLAGAANEWRQTRAMLDSADRVQGEVIDMARSPGSTTYAPHVRFTARSGAEYEFTSSTSSNPPEFSSGDIVEVLYDPASPEDAIINSFMQLWFGALLLGGMGTIFFSIGLFLVTANLRARRRISRLQATGKPVLADYQCVELNTSLVVNGRSPYRLVAQWQNPRTRKIHIFKSENLWFNPEKYVDRQQVSVLVDPKKLARYYMDISFLPETVE